MISPFRNPASSLHALFDLDRIFALEQADAAALDLEPFRAIYSLSEDEARMLGQLRRAHPDNQETMLIMWRLQSDLSPRRAMILADLIDSDGR